VQGHAVLDAGGQVELLGLGVEDTFLPAEGELNGQQG
jgi:hypothetical protein